MTRYYLSILKQVVDNGGVIAYPTEAVFGLGCRPDDYLAVKNILGIKQRPENKGLILIASNRKQIMPYIQKPKKHIWDKIIKTWPGHTSWAIPASDICPSWISGSHSTVVVRVSRHPVVRMICDTLGYPIVSTSANISNRIALNSAIKVRKNIGEYIDLLVPGNVGKAQNSSTIYDATNGRQIR